MAESARNRTEIEEARRRQQEYIEQLIDGEFDKTVGDFDDHFDDADYSDDEFE